MSNLIYLEKITLNNKNILFITPQNDCFAMIYRSAMGVHWDNDSKSLYFASPIEHENNILKAYKQIVLAVKEEYGKILKLQPNTIFENIDETSLNCLKNL